MSTSTSPFEVPQRPESTRRQGEISLESVAEDLGRQDGDLRVLKERIKSLIDREDSFATKEWMYWRLFAYVLPFVGLLVITVVGALIGAVYAFNYGFVGMMLDFLNQANQGNPRFF